MSRAKGKALAPGLFEVHGRIGFLGAQTQQMAHFVELAPPPGGGEYCCKGGGMRHPAAGMYAKKTSARRAHLWARPDEITKAMRAQWAARIKEACPLMWGRECRLKGPRK